mgnify:FL=1
MKEITEDIFYVGVNDHITDLFEGQYKVPRGMAYNSYVILDEKTAVFDTVDHRFSSEWLSNLDSVLSGKNPDYIIIQHMEPDHSSSLEDFIKKYPNAKIIATPKAFDMMNAFFPDLDITQKTIAAENGGSFSLGKHEFSFIYAPMVHWPEVMLTYDKTSKTLFSADAFGKFGSLDTEEDWACEARRYYFGIVGKYGAQVQTLLKKAAALEIERICPLHGPILNENIEYYVNLYDIWSSYRAESKGIFIAYTSIYGNTKKAALSLAEKLKEKGCEKVALSDLAEDDMAEAVEDAFRYDRLVLASPTYNADVFPFMRHFIEALTERNYQDRTVGFIENGSWAPTAAKVMKKMLENSKNLRFLSNDVTIKSAPNDGTEKALDSMAEELCR